MKEAETNYLYIITWLKEALHKNELANNQEKGLEMEKLLAFETLMSPDYVAPQDN